MARLQKCLWVGEDWYKELRASTSDLSAQKREIKKYTNAQKSYNFGAFVYFFYV